MKVEWEHDPEPFHDPKKPREAARQWQHLMPGAGRVAGKNESDRVSPGQQPVATPEAESDWSRSSPAPAQGGPEDGHTFRISFISRGSYKVREEPDHHDAEWDSEEERRSVEVRAWSLKEALEKALDLPFATWFEE